ncbi:MAG: hypothetical protein ABUS51_06345 [Acidobacteriota bacterium]
MKEMDGTLTSSWKVVFDKHQAALAEELSSRLEAEFQEMAEQAATAERLRLVAEHEEALDRAIREARTEGAEAARRTTAEALNQALRRLRQAPSLTAALETLADASAPWARRAVVIAVEGNSARSRATRGLSDHEEIAFDLDAAGAVSAAVESKDPVVAVASPAELSPALAALLTEGTEDRKAYLFPIAVRQNVVAMLLASGAVTPAPLELLCEAAGMKLEFPVTPAPVPAASPELVQIAPTSAPPASAAADAVPHAASRWEELSLQDQKLHLQAQRVARVRVAELRLYNAEQLRKGVFACDIYAALQTGIDGARAEFLQVFLSNSSTMVDYLHLEILRSLAHDDARLLGKDYPGPMV